MFRFIRKWLFLALRNRVVRQGESGGFKWKFRRFGLEISTASGNFREYFTAGEHPFGYLIAGKDDKNIKGYCELLYEVGMLLTTEKQFAEDVMAAVRNYDRRLNGPVEEDPVEEEIALEEVKRVQEQVEKVRRRRKRNGDKG